MRAGEHLLRTARHEGNTSYWPCEQDGRVHYGYGYGYGASGIALLLLHLHLRAGDARFRTRAVRALEFDLAHTRESGTGLQWRRFRDDTVMYPYWIHGSAGIGSVLVRFHHPLGIERCGALAAPVPGARAVPSFTRLPVPVRSVPLARCAHFSRLRCEYVPYSSRADRAPTGDSRP
ncbi:lanthionine synthetase LanC family protein [Streptomyces sp. NPDC058625]|uniref:lanthionine synthetase LanC family protein n=1 Tax=Streptomyces sp. NPDC058625 TaxID=3346564 RepID=UPI003646B09C